MIIMLNCSYKSKNSNTQYFLEKLKSELKGKKCEMITLKSVFKSEIKDFVEMLRKADALVIGAPLYVDGLPAQAVKLLELLLENYKGQFPELPVYVVSNLGFYESGQIKNLMAIVENWCKRTGMPYGGGLAIGAGPMIRALENMPLKSGPNKDIGKGLEKLANAITQKTAMDNYYCKTMIPRVVYLKAAHATFRKSMKENGVNS